MYTYTWYIIYKHTITVLFQVPRRIVPSSPTKTTFSATPWTAQSRSTRHGASHRSPRCPCCSLSTWKTHGFVKANGNPNLVHHNFSWKFSSRKCGHRNCLVWISKELWIVFIYYTLFNVAHILPYTKWETCNLCSIPNSMCQKVAHKKKRGVSRFFVVKVP